MYYQKCMNCGIYNAILGGDRKIDTVCDLIREPRTAEEAREYYKIENVQSTQTIDDVTEQEVQNILIHYKRLGKNEDRYADSFNNIAAQYTDKQLKIIIKCLPINVRAVLEAECPKYQELVTYSDETEQEKKQKEKLQEQRRIEQIENERKLKNKIEKEKRDAIRNAQRSSIQAQNQSAINNSGIDLLDNKNKQPRMTGNVIIPNSMDIRNERKIYSEEDLMQIESRPRQAKEQTFDLQKATENLSSEEQFISKSTLPGLDIEQQDIKENSLPGFEDLELDLNEPKIQEQPAEPIPSMEDIALPVTEIDEPVQQHIEAVIPAGEEPPKKRGRGRPRKYPIEPPKPKGKRGRPRKNPLPEENVAQSENQPIKPLNIDEPILETTQELPGFEDLATMKDSSENNELANLNTNSLSSVLPGFEDLNDELSENKSEENNKLSLPGLDLFDETEKTDTTVNLENDDLLANLPGLDEEYKTSNSFEDSLKESSSTNQIDESYIKTPSYDLPGLDFDNRTKTNNIYNDNNLYNGEQNKKDALQKLESNRNYSTGSLNTVLTKDKKVVAFVGASKNGTSFLVNNLACLFSSIGVKTAILDMTQNKNSYYIYTNNDEKLRNIAYTSIENLENGIAEGIKVDRNLEIFTAVPNDGKDYSNSEAILSTLIQNESLVLIDCDFDTDPGYFANAQEIYLVQSMDILTIQPLTAFLRDLKTKGILDPEKLRIVINKELRVRNLTSRAVIGGMSFYNDPAMSYMTELFSKDKIKACTIPFDENVYSRYLEAMVNCVVSINGYTKNFMNSLKILGNMVYPLLSKQTYGTKTAESAYGNNFSSEMNNTLNQMRNKY